MALFIIEKYILIKYLKFMKHLNQDNSDHNTQKLKN
jgi:hypothetical protein